MSSTTVPAGGGTTILNAAGGTGHYSFSAPDTAQGTGSFTSSTPQSLTYTASDTYTIAVNDSWGFGQAGQCSVKVVAPTASIKVVDTSNGNSVSAPPTGGSLSVAYGASVSINWSSSGYASSCSGSGTNSTAPSGNWGKTSLTTSQTFSVTCKNAYGVSSPTESVKVNVGSAPPSVSIGCGSNASGTACTIPYGASTTIRWNDTNLSGSDSCQVTDVATGNTSWGSGTSNSKSTGPLTSSGAYTYRVSCTNPAGATGNSPQSVTVNVSAAPPPSVSINCNGGSTCSVPYGGSAMINWADTNGSGADTCTVADVGVNPNWGNGTKNSQSTGSLTNSCQQEKYQISCSGPGGTGNSPQSVTVNVGLTSNSTTTVISQNSQPISGNNKVVAGFIFSSAPSGAQCKSSSCSCKNGKTCTDDVYPQPAAGCGSPYIIKGVNPPILSNGNPAYTFNSAKEQTVTARPKTLFDGIFAFVGNLFGSVARALSYSPSQNQTLFPAQLNSASTPSWQTWTILWDPVALMNLSASSLTFTPVSPGSVTISNTGSPGSSLVWSVTALDATTKATPTWMNFTSPTSGTVSNGSTNVTFAGTTSAPGIHHATLYFVGTSTVPSTGLPNWTAYTAQVKVTYTVAVVTMTKISPLSPAVIWPGTPVSFSCSTNPAGSGIYTWQSPGGSPSSVTATSSPYTTSYTNTSAVPYTVSCTDTTYNVGTSTSVTVIGPQCSSFKSNPKAIIPPEQATLSWSCKNIGKCTITSATGDLNISTTTANGSLTVTPVAGDTSYTLFCVGAGGNTSLPADQVTKTTSVSIQSTQLHETNP